MGLFGGILKIGTSLIGGNTASKASKRAAELQYKGTQEGIAEQRRQFDITRQDYQPYLTTGVEALGGIGDLTGLNGGDAQGSAIAALRESPLFKSLFQSGQENVLQTAAATGGVRGGNTIAALYNQGEDTLTRVIESQLARLGGLAGLGSGATDAVSQFGATTAGNIANLINQGSTAQARGVLGSAAAKNKALEGAASGLTDILSSFPGFSMGF